MVLGGVATVFIRDGKGVELCTLRPGMVMRSAGEFAQKRLSAPYQGSGTGPCTVFWITEDNTHLGARARDS